MRRRQVLGAVGLALGTAGCLADTDPAGSTTETTTDEPPFGDVPCPAFPDHASRTVCYHTMQGDEPIYLEPSTQEFVVDPDDDTVEALTFTLHNDSPHGFGLNPYDWAVKRRTENGWEHVTPEAIPQPWTEIESGDTYRWSLSTTTHPSPNTERTTFVTVDLEPGTYAFVVDGLAGDGKDSSRLACVALFSYREE